MFPEVQRGLFGFLTEELVVFMHLVSNHPSHIVGKAYFARSWVYVPTRSRSTNVAASRGRFALFHRQTQDEYKLRQGFDRDQQAA